MNKFKVSRILISMPFFLIGVAFLGGVVWLGVDRLFGGFEWQENDVFIIGWMVGLTIFGGAFIQFGKDALYKGHSEEGKPLVGPVLYYIVGGLILIPGVWSFLAGSQQALMVSVVGVASIIYGVLLSLRSRKKDLPNNSSGPSAV